MKVTLLGTGSPVPSLKRASAGYMVEVGSDVVLIDHGPGCFRNMMQAGIAVTDVTHVIFSHLHFDHCADFIRLFFHRWDIGSPGLASMKVFDLIGYAVTSSSPNEAKPNHFFLNILFY